MSTNTMNTNNQPVHNTNAPVQKNKKPFAFKLLIAAIVLEIVAAIACIGAAYPTFPWGDSVVVFAIFALIVAVWLWGYNAATKKK